MANPTEQALATHIQAATGVQTLPGAQAFPLATAMPVCIVLLTTDRSDLDTNGSLRRNMPGRPNTYTAWYLYNRRVPSAGGVPPAAVTAREDFRRALKASFTGQPSTTLTAVAMRVGVPLEFLSHKDGLLITFLDVDYIGWEVRIGVEENLVFPS